MSGLRALPHRRPHPNVPRAHFQGTPPTLTQPPPPPNKVFPPSLSPPRKKHNISKVLCGSCNLGPSYSAELYRVWGSTCLHAARTAGMLRLTELVALRPLFQASSAIHWAFVRPYAGSPFFQFMLQAADGTSGFGGLPVSTCRSALWCLNEGEAVASESSLPGEETGVPPEL